MTVIKKPLNKKLRLRRGQLFSRHIKHGEQQRQAGARFLKMN